MKNKTFYVYVYLDPRKLGKYLYGDYFFNYEPFYMGKGKNDRKYDHLKEAKNKSITKGNKHKFYKIKQILNDGLEPIINVIDYFNSAKEALDIEKSMISIIGRRDLKQGPLVNLTDGGRGMLNFSEDVKRKISNSLKGNIPWNKGLKGCYKKETRIKISNSLRGRKGKPLTCEQKQIISQCHKGKIVSWETRRKLSISGKGRVPWNKGKKNVQIAWNKGLHIPRKIYKFIKNGEVLEIKDLKTYCKINGLVYASMIVLNNGKGFYGKKGRYKSYERFL
ncbi:hypothetical protein LCGC14_1685900 [marine sediment metagenome]|uniref:GIY-YIG domain-containing protein n=1 Tax=marine sediment metagenome TaxID=412755 RepID=A0A0F9K2T3_9ZZZZ